MDKCCVGIVCVGLRVSSVCLKVCACVFAVRWVGVCCVKVFLVWPCLFRFIIVFDRLHFDFEIQDQ